MEKENEIQKAIRQKDEIMQIIKKGFLQIEQGEDNSWRVKHNEIILEMQIERPIFEYFKKLAHSFK